MSSHVAPDKNPLHLTAALIDVETTGLSPLKHEVIELAICLFEVNPDQGHIHRIVDVYTGLREPARPIPPAASAIHGLVNEDVRGKRLDTERIGALIHQADVIIAHNASFDYGFVTRLFPAAAQKPWLCSMRHIPWRSYGLEKKSLAYLLEQHGLINDQAHRAKDDVAATLKLLATKNSKGRTYLKDLLETGEKMRKKAK